MNNFTICAAGKSAASEREGDKQTGLSHFQTFSDRWHCQSQCAVHTYYTIYFSEYGSVQNTVMHDG